MNNNIPISNYKQLSVWVSKVRLNPIEPSTKNKIKIDAVYSILTLCFNNLPEQQDTSRRAYYTQSCGITTVENNKEAINKLVNRWKEAESANIEYQLRAAEVMLRDHEHHIASVEVLEQIIENLNLIHALSNDEIISIIKHF